MREPEKLTGNAYSEAVVLNCSVNFQLGLSFLRL